jgi:hypothetical protein
MNFLDKIALNRLIKIITDFILAVLKIISNSSNKENITRPQPKFPWIRKNIDKILPKK